MLDTVVIFVLWAFFVTPSGNLPYPVGSYKTERECQDAMHSARSAYVDTDDIKFSCVVMTST